MDALFLIAIIVIIGTSLWVGFDAQNIGVKKGQLKGVCDMAPAGWMFACLGLWIVAFPAYLSVRDELKRLNQRVPATPNPSNNLEEQLRQLARLGQRNIISDEEFAQKKKTLLGI